MLDNFVKYCISKGASLSCLDIPSDDTNHLGICNPSIFVDGNVSKLILRNVNYSLWNSDISSSFNSPYGPLCYVTSEDDVRLKTDNFLCVIDGGGKLSYRKIDMTYDKEPVWDFVGLEDARLVRWNGKLYITGVRRDTVEDGQGRMELSWIDDDGVELSRVRIQSPSIMDSEYCEKNWMPVLDMPYHYVRWCNPLQIVKVDPETGVSEIVFEGEKVEDSGKPGFDIDGMQTRGSSQVITCGEYRIALTHTCSLWFNEKNQKSDGDYMFRFFVWDKAWNVVAVSEPFKFMGFSIEFSNGLAFYENGRFKIPFAVQDGISFMLDVDCETVNNFINGDYEESDYSANGDGCLASFVNNTKDSYACISLAQKYYSDGHYAASAILAQRACTFNTFRSPDDLYESVFVLGLSLSNLGNRDTFEKSVWLRMIDILPNRSEGYLMMSMFCWAREQYQEAYTFARLAYTKNFYKIDSNMISSVDGDIQYAKTIYATERFAESEGMFEMLIKSGKLNDRQMIDSVEFLGLIRKNKENRKRVL